MAAAKAKPDKPAQVSLLDSKRAYNISITLSQFRTTHSALRDSLLAMDDKMMTVDALLALAKAVPTPEEVETVRAYDGDPALLGLAERFFLTIGEIPNLGRRVDANLFRATFKTQRADLESSLEARERASTTLRSSSALRKLLKVVLAFGNYMNGGTRKGQQYGFRLATLEKLSGTKTSDGKMSLLEYLVKTVNEKVPEAREFLADMEVVERAARVDSAYQEGEMAKMQLQLRKTHGAVKQSSEDSSKDRFRSVMTEFLEDADKGVADLHARLERADVLHQDVCKFFGENPKKVKPEDLYGMFAKLATEYRSAEAKIKKRAEDEERARRREEAKQAQAAKTASKSTPKAPAAAKAARDPAASPKPGKAKKVVNETLNTLRPNDATVIMKMLKQRRKQRKSVISVKHNRTASRSKRNAIAKALKGIQEG